MIKKGLLSVILLSAFLIGMSFGSAPAVTPQPAAPPPTPLEQAIAQFEEDLQEGREITPYSHAHRSVGIPGTQDNAVARFGQGIGTFLQGLVREMLRTIVIFFDRLIGS